MTCSPGGTKKLENSFSNTNWDIGISKVEIIDLDIQDEFFLFLILTLHDDLIKWVRIKKMKFLKNEDYV